MDPLDRDSSDIKSELNPSQLAQIEAFQPHQILLQQARTFLESASRELGQEPPTEATIRQAAKILGVSLDNPSQFPTDSGGTLSREWLLTEATIQTGGSVDAINRAILGPKKDSLDPKIEGKSELLLVYSALLEKSPAVTEIRYGFPGSYQDFELLNGGFLTVLVSDSALAPGEVLLQYSKRGSSGLDRVERKVTSPSEAKAFATEMAARK